MEGRPLVTVSIPAYEAGNHILRCVESVLAQSIKDIRVYVINDGGPPDDLDCLKAINDPRLVVARSEVNRGRYAVDHHVASIAESKWFAICDADDWVEPNWLESMIDAWDGKAKVVVAPHFEHGLRDGKQQYRPISTYDGKFKWHTHMGACLWDAEWVRQTHATNPNVRVGWDNVMTALPFLLRCGTKSGVPAYHRVNRANSLTRSRSTGMNSELRQETVRILREAWAKMVKQPNLIPEIVAGMTIEKNAFPLLNNPRISRTEWALDREGLIELDAYLWRERPQKIVETGSGMSTLVLANYAKQTGASVTSLEHLQKYHRETRRKLQTEKLQNAVNLLLTSLKDNPPRYEATIPDGVDFALIDGPPEYAGGRSTTLPMIHPHLAESWEVWLDDSSRDGEVESLNLWRKELKVAVSKNRIGRDITRITPKRKYAKNVKADGVVIGILTGWRPAHLSRALASLPKGFLESAHVIVIHDGADEATVDVLNDYRDVIDQMISRRHPSLKMHSIGDNMSLLAEKAQGHGDFFFMLEDDWEFRTADDRWLDNALEVIANNGVHQVRLRHASEKVLPRHMVTNKPIVWSPYKTGMIGQAHFTTNPSIVRIADLEKMWPADGEKAMQKNAVSNGLINVWQSYPGAFHHIGDHSMREETNCKA